MVNYNESMIYKLCCNDINITDIYIGSTTNFNRRKQQHKISCYNKNGIKYNQLNYKFIRDHGGFENWSMVLIENISVNDIHELHKKEREYIEKLNPTLNSRIPSRGVKERYLLNKDKIKNYKQQHYLNNKEKTKEYNRTQYLNRKEEVEKKRLCECGSIVRTDYLTKHKKTNKHLKNINK